MNPFKPYFTINATDVFLPGDFPEIEKEIGMIKAQVKELRNTEQCAVMISYFKDHKIQMNLAQSQVILVDILLSMNSCRYIEGLFQASKDNEPFRTRFENYLSNELRAKDEIRAT
jgi:hypothetical protein